MGKNKKTGKRQGHKVAQPGALGEQILSARYAKETKRTKARGNKEESSKTKYLNATAVLSELQKLNEDVYSEEPQQEPHLLQPGDDDDLPTPQNVLSHIKEFEQEIVGGVNTAEEERLFALLMPEDSKKQSTFMEQVRDTLQERQTEIQTQIDEQSMAGGPNISPEVQELCKKAGEALCNYRRRPLPKIMKTIPMMKNWLHLLYYTNPDQWSAAAMFEMTRQFRSKRSDIVQVFYSTVLLPRCRDDIAHYKSLNAHLFGALRLALFKPAVFFRGIILPLCMSGDSTLREAIIFGSVLSKCKIPVLASAAAIVYISKLSTYSGANSIFLRVLLNKKYALQWTVIDAVVDHFVSFKCESRQLPVLWHQSLLTFVQRYKEDLSIPQKESLFGLAAFHTHHTITPEVRRELESSKCNRQ